MILCELRHKKTGIRCFRPGPIQTSLYSHRNGLETSIFGNNKRDCTIHVVKTKALISYAVTAQLIRGFVFAYVDCWFSVVALQFCGGVLNG